MQRRFEKKIMHLVFLPFLLIFNARCMEKLEVLSWSSIGKKDKLCVVKAACFDRSGTVAFVGGSKYLAQLIVLGFDEPLESSEFHLTDIESDVESAVFNPQQDKLAVLTSESVFLFDYGFAPEFWCDTTFDLVHDGYVKLMCYNDAGTKLAFISDKGKIGIWNTIENECVHQVDLKLNVISAQFLPKESKLEDDLLLGGVGSIGFYRDLTLRVFSVDCGEISVNACFDKDSCNIMEVLGDGSDLMEVNPDTLEILEVENYQDLSMKVCLNFAKYEVLLVKRTESNIIIKNRLDNVIAILPKEYDISHAILSFDGERLITVLKGDHNVLFWQKKQH